MGKEGQAGVGMRVWREDENQRLRKKKKEVYKRKEAVQERQ